MKKWNGFSRIMSILEVTQGMETCKANKKKLEVEEKEKKEKEEQEQQEQGEQEQEQQGEQDA